MAELGPDSRIAVIARFCAKTLTGLPSILAGVFAYAAVVLITGTYSAPPGGIALALLMVPAVMLTAEEAMKMVPRIMKDAAHGIGCTHSQVVTKVVITHGDAGDHHGRDSSRGPGRRRNRPPLVYGAVQ